MEISTLGLSQKAYYYNYKNYQAVAIELNMAKYILKNEFDILPFFFL